MREFDAFRRGLAEALAACADARAAPRNPGRERDAAVLLRRLAADAVNLDLHVFLLWQLLLTHDDLTERLRLRCDHLFAQVGVTVWPDNATDLVRWMLGQAIGGGHARLRIAAGRPVAVDVGVRPDRPRVRSSGTLTVAGEFTAGLGIVAPILSMLAAVTGLRQWHERAIAATRPAATARVVAVAPALPVRTGPPHAAVTLSFSPLPGAPPCLATVSTAVPAAPGAFLTVVPRSPACEPPLVPSEVGDPVVSFAVAAALMAGGVASLRLWDCIWRRSHRGPPARLRPARPARSPAVRTG